MLPPQHLQLVPPSIKIGPVTGLTLSKDNCKRSSKEELAESWPPELSIVSISTGFPWHHAQDRFYRIVPSKMMVMFVDRMIAWHAQSPLVF
jgi:kynurenine formamidase